MNKWFVFVGTLTGACALMVLLGALFLVGGNSEESTLGCAAFISGLFCLVQLVDWWRTLRLEAAWQGWCGDSGVIGAEGAE